MKDEIKEAIDNLNGVVKGIYRMDEAGLEIKDIERLLDYITNLEEENKNRISESLSYDLAKARVKELEQRIDKAIEYIKKVIEENDEWYEYRENKLLNILQGDDIIEELEKWIKDYIPLLEAGDIVEETTQDTLKEVLNKIKELKEGKQ